MTLPTIVLEPLVRQALLEDFGRGGDLTTNSTVPAAATGTATLTAREDGVVAGLDLALLAFTLLDEASAEVHHRDGEKIEAGTAIATLTGPARALLTGERTALNFISHLSGIATATRAIADRIAHTSAHIVCTRKTTPGLRTVEKYAVVAGGGMNHRFGLDDAVLIKDNHIALAGGIAPALTAAKTQVGHMVKVEIEVDTLQQLREVVEIGADAVLLDNMSPETLTEAVKIVDGQFLTEASGRIHGNHAVAVAETGVDLISSGWLTHSSPILDIGLDITTHAG